MTPAWRARKGAQTSTGWLCSVKPTSLEDRQWPSRSFVGSNPSPAAHPPDGSWLSRFGGLQKQLKSCCLVRLRTGLGNRLVTPGRSGTIRAQSAAMKSGSGPMVEPSPGCYEGGQEVSADRPGPRRRPISKHGGATGAQARGQYRPRRWARPSQRNQATKPPLTRGASGRVKRTLCEAIINIPGLVQQPDRLTGSPTLPNSHSDQTSTGGPTAPNEATARS